MIRYTAREAQGDLSRAAELGKALRLDPVCARLLCMRGMDTPEKARAFLEPTLSGLHDPFLFEQMQDAVDCIFAAVDMGEKICVYGDYDVDGIMAVTILTRYLRSIGADVIGYIPSRHNEGYGLNNAAIDSLAEQGVSLIVTVDCGISAIEEARHAAELGLEMVITDHHQCLEELPECAALIDPARRDGYPFKYLCGAGVALKLVQALGGDEAIEPYLQFAAFATVADIVDLSDENRILVTQGLKRINDNDCCAGMKQLAEAAGYTNRPIDASAIGFSLAPRVNAAGRTGSPQRALELFLTDDPQEARALARELNEENANRQRIEREITQQALEKIAQGEVNLIRERAVILWGEGWNHGVIGIVASKLVERFNKPVILFGIENGVCTGSGRSVPGIHLFRALSAFSEMFVRFGGHEMAAGLTIEQEKLQTFKELFCQYLEREIPSEVFIPRASYDLAAQPQALTLRLAEQLSRLAPFGIGNPKPVFRVSSRVKSARLTGQEQDHLKFALDNDVDCIAFWQGRRIRELSGQQAELLLSLEINEWNGRRSAQCQIRKVRIQPPADGAAFIQPNIWKFYDALFDAILYNKKVKGEGICPIDHGQLSQLLRQEPQGTLVLCHTPENACALLHWMKQEELFECADLAFGSIDDENGYNAVLFAPKLEGCSLGRYRQIVLFDDCLCPGELGMLEGAGELMSLGHSCDDFLASAAMERGALVPLFKGMCALSHRGGAYLDFEGYAAALQGLHRCEAHQVLLALRVFEELGFIKIKNEGSFCVSVTANAPRRELEQSALFVSVRDAEKEYRRMCAEKR